MNRVSAIVVSIALTMTTLAQPVDRQAAELERMVSDGMVEALESRFSGAKSTDQLRLLALAHANKAAKQRDARARDAEFENASRRLDRWLSAIDTDSAVDKDARPIAAAIARTEYAGLLLSRGCEADLSEFEMTAGRRGDAKALAARLNQARALFDKAVADIDPLARRLRERDPAAQDLEDRLLALGLFDAVKRTRVDARFNLAWSQLYLGIVDEKNREQRITVLSAAERTFASLLDEIPEGPARARCLLGQAMGLREQGRHDDADRKFDEALTAAEAIALQAQIRFEHAKGEVAAGRFDEAREILKALTSLDVEKLPAEQAPARFYANMAALWDAYSYFLQADKLRAAAQSSPAREALLKQAEKLRETGVAGLGGLVARGGPWPDLVNLYVAQFIPAGADPRTLSPAELLFSARSLIAAKKERQALLRLQDAAARKDIAPALLGDVLFEMGSCEYAVNRRREAAEAFDRLAGMKTHPRSSQAAGLAYQLWAIIAEESKKPDDYGRLAASLLTLIQSFPQHEKRAEAMWWLPVALQGAGRYAEAIEQFGNVPQTSAHWEEAQYRRVMSQRLVFESSRATLAEEKLVAESAKLADALGRYAAAAIARAEKAKDAAVIRKWAATALVSAAELLVSKPLERFDEALEKLAKFETDYGQADLMARVLAVRINAYRGKSAFEEAARVVEQYLKAVPVEQAGSVLASVARGMLEEVERLESEDRRDDARKLATESLSTFEQLEAWAAADPARAGQLDGIRFAAARLRLLAGNVAAALKAAEALLAGDERNGAYLQLVARCLSAGLGDESDAAAIDAAKAAWSRLLRDPELRTKKPEVYWEARYEFLSLEFRAGRRGEVAKAIREERLWSENMGGERWQSKFDALYAAAGGDTAAGAPTSAESGPASAPSGPPGE